ncbi:hypothetical protein PROFUN_09259 [Planoprotostelium fungivorum]|uniref:PH domain-containing protein n=1 Tax=Planoprotostelium fungivorum TaxID=1890364 RepID=A0A2P6NKX9_9EUKA|nr:hypothetical protein PROFUN_09259 [Planoprotostelium fungivorum]
MASSFEQRWALINDGTRGSDGKVGIDGGGTSSYAETGPTGGTGGNGGGGTAAGRITLSIRSEDGLIIGDSNLGPSQTISEERSSTRQWSLGDPSASIQLSARGGDGGTGGKGGKGGRGGPGFPGVDATSTSSGTDGGIGGRGGKGGTGGSGGQSGDGADIRVNVREEDLDLLMCLEQEPPRTTAGTGGSGGVGGEGGRGGPGVDLQPATFDSDPHAGGPGGASYSWTVSTLETDSDGNSYSSTTTYTNPGGSSGPTGISGPTGPLGHSGKFVVVVDAEGGQTEHSNFYDLSLRSVQYVDSEGYRIVEPGGQLLCWSSFKNVGGLYTPTHQTPWVYVKNNEWLTCEDVDRLPLKKKIMPNKVHSLERPLRLYVSDVPYVSQGKPLNVQTDVRQMVVMERVNKTFHRIEKTSTPIVIRHPVQSSIIRGATCISRTEEAPIVFSIDNISTKSIGINNGMSKDDVCLRNSDGIVCRNNLFSELTRLLPEQSTHFTCTLQCINSNVMPYTRMKVVSTLYLGHVRDMLIPRPIQQREFEVQLAETYVPDPSADFLLVVNNRTTLAEAEAWRDVIRTYFFGKVVVWNINLYEDLNLSHTKRDGTSLLQDMRGKNIIFLNNQVTVHEEETEMSGSYMRSKEFYLAARDYGINTFIFGEKEPIDVKSEMIPWLPRASRVVLYKTKRDLFTSMEKRLQPGTGAAQAFSGGDTCDLCGFTNLNNRLVWTTLRVKEKTLCYYNSPNANYPEGMVFLESVEVRKEETVEEGLVIRIIGVHGDNFHIGSPESFKEEFYKKRNKCKVTLNHTTEMNMWWKAISDIPSIRDYVLPSPLTVKQGWLKKKNKEGTAFFYSKRYFVLDSARKTLSYYDNAHTSKAKRIFYLGRYFLTVGDYYGGSGKHPELKFQIRTPSHTLFLCAESTEDRDAWASAVTSVNAPMTSPSQHREVRGINKNNASPLPNRVKDLSIGNTEQVDPEEQVVHKILVEERYLLSNPTEDDLRVKAEKLREKLKARFPNQNNVVVYEFSHDPEPKMGLHRLGYLYVHRGLDDTSTQLLHFRVARHQAHDVERMYSAQSLFALMKLMDFPGKVKIMDEHLSMETERGKKWTESESPLGLSVQAVLSDLLDEQREFRKSEWKEGLDTQMIRSRMDKLEYLASYSFRSIVDHPQPIDTTTADAMAEIGAALKTVCEESTSVKDKILMNRRSTNVNKATRELWQTIQDKITSPTKNGTDIFMKRMKSHTSISPSISLPEQGRLDSPKVYDKSSFDSLRRPNASNHVVLEERYVFENQTQRMEGIEGLQRSEFLVEEGELKGKRCAVGQQISDLTRWHEPVEHPKKEYDVSAMIAMKATSKAGSISITTSDHVDEVDSVSTDGTR